MASSEELRGRLKAAVETLNLSAAISAIHEMDTDDVALILEDKMERPGAYQIRGNRLKRNTFYDALLNSVEMSDRHEAIWLHFFGVNETIKKIEACFDIIRGSLPKCEISKFPLDVQFWSHVELAQKLFIEVDCASKKEFEKVEAKLKQGIPTIIPESTLIELERGQTGNVDAIYGGLIEALSLTLKMIAFEKKLLSQGKLVAPARPLITENHIEKAGAIQHLAITWNTLEDAANRTLFFGGELLNAQEAGVSIEEMPPECMAQFPDQFAFKREPSSAEYYDFIANRRLHTWATQNTMHMRSSKPLRAAVMKEGAAVPDISDGFISESEGITLATLSEILSYDVFVDQERFHGLTLREWVRGYCVLTLIANEQPNDSILLTLTKYELEQSLRRYKIPDAAISNIIFYLTFGVDSRDLYDSPLIYSGDGKYTFFANVVKSWNLANIVFSRLSSLSTQFEKKGKGFEDRVQSSFLNWGCNCKFTKFKRGDDEYEYDALVLIDNTLLIIECKNNLLSGNNSVQAFRYWQSVQKNASQVRRLESGLKKYPEVVMSLFGRSVEELTLVPVILNSLTYSREPIDGVYVSDWSSLSKFFRESSISEFFISDGEKVKGRTIHKLWSGDRPTIDELLEYLKFPIQVAMIARNFSSRVAFCFMSERSMFYTMLVDIDEHGLHELRGTPGSLQK